VIAQSRKPIRIAHPCSMPSSRTQAHPRSTCGPTPFAMPPNLYRRTLLCLANFVVFPKRQKSCNL
jgi:hypothetical protein